MKQTALDRVIDSTQQVWRLQQAFNLVGWVDEPMTFDRILRDQMKQYGANLTLQDIPPTFKTRGKVTWDESLGDLTTKRFGMGARIVPR